MLTKTPEEDSIRRILDSRARLLARPLRTESAAGETVQLLAFRLGPETYGVEVELVRETQPLSALNWTLVPCSPEFVVGAVNIRGRIFPIIDVAKFFGLPKRPLPSDPYVLLVDENGEGGHRIETCLLADEMPRMFQVAGGELKEPAAFFSNRAQEFLRGMTDERLIILDLRKLLSDPGIIVHEED
jgi:purine-binding chemotaxis protein CheW